MQTLLINKAKVASVLQVAIGTTESEFNNFINEAQSFDLKPQLPEAFYFDLVQNRGSEPYVKLLAGGSYMWENNQIFFDGLANALAYFTYARFIHTGPIVSTSHGVVQKTNPYSEAVPLEERRSVNLQKKREGMMIFEDVIKYIERNKDLFPKYFNNGTCKTVERAGAGFKTSVIK